MHQLLYTIFITGTVGVFDGWSSYGTLTLERSRADRECEESAVDNRRPLLFDEGEGFTLRVGFFSGLCKLRIGFFLGR